MFSLARGLTGGDGAVALVEDSTEGVDVFENAIHALLGGKLLANERLDLLQRGNRRGLSGLLDLSRREQLCLEGCR